MSNDLKRKLSSRKFWAALSGFVCAAALAFGVADSAVSQAAAVISAAGVLAAYILGEAHIDAGK